MKNKILAISYGDESFTMSRALNLWTAKHIGRADSTLAYGPENIDSAFYNENIVILTQKRGGGYWLWKPYIILKALEQTNEGDYVFYTDAGMIYSHSIKILIQHMTRDRQDICLSSGFVPAKDWCKRDCFILMGCDNELAYEKTMVSGGYVLIKKTDRAVTFVRDWLKYAKDERISTDIPNQLGKPNIKGFKEHRHDQAILSNLCFKYNIEPYKAMSHVDEPRAHRSALKGNVGVYGYSFEQRIELIKKEHESLGYKRSKYPRLFINTRVRNCNLLIFCLKLIKKILVVLVTDIWGTFFDKKYL